MNSTRRLQFFVSRLLGRNCLHQSAAVQYVIQMPNISHCVKFLQNTTSCTCRNFISVSESNTEQKQASTVGDDEIPTFSEFLSQLPSQEEYTDALMKALDCKKDELKIIQNENLFWRSLAIDTVVERIEAFKKLGVRKDDLVKHSSVIFVDFEYSYQLLNSACKKLGYNGHILFPLLLAPKKIVLSYLSELSNDSEHLDVYGNRIKFFSSKLEIPVRNFTEMLVEHSHLLQLPIRRITEMMDILLDAGVARKDIYNDLWVFRFNVEKARERLQYCEMTGLKNVKPWIVRCSEETFCNAVKYRKVKQSVSKGLSWVEFVAQSLNCPLEEVEAMVKYDRRVEKVGFLKTKKTINFLIAEGFSPKEILLSPHVFCTSIRMIERRMNIMKEAGLQPKNHPEVLRRMCLSHKAFLDTLKEYKAD